MPILESLAELAIEQEFKISRKNSHNAPASTNVKGFYKLFENEIVEKLIKDEPIPIGTNIIVPDTVSIIARKDGEFYAFLNMKSDRIDQVSKGVNITFINSEDSCQFGVGLNFVDNKLLFDPLTDMGRRFNLNTVDGIENEIKFRKLQWCMLCNGKLEIWDEETHSLLGITDTYFLVNMMIDIDVFNNGIRELENNKRCMQANA